MAGQRRRSSFDLDDDAFNRALGVQFERMKLNSKREVKALSFKVKNKTQEFTAVDTGRLRNGWTNHNEGVDELGPWVDVENDVEYACVFDAHTQVVVEGKSSCTIGQVKVGDKVLTATGEYREVLRTFRFPVSEKPDLVTFEVPWRADKNHSLTVTTDHKMAVLREGRIVWLPAGEVLGSDQLWVRRKKDHKKGTRATGLCFWCGGTRPAAQTYCSISCRSQHWENGANPHVGMKRSDKARQLMKSRRVEYFVKSPESHPNALVAKMGHKAMTEVEKQVADWLDMRGLKWQHNKVINRKWADFYVAETNEVYEADGAYWHRDQSKDIERDRAMLEADPSLRITHIHFHDPRHSPTIDPDPLPGVRYVVCNPSTKSFVEPDTYEARTPISIRHWTWEPVFGKTGRRPAPYLYDLTVDGVHSFVASGILVSNSHQEFGTRPHEIPGAFGRPGSVTHPGTQANPALRPAMLEAATEWKPRIVD